MCLEVLMLSCKRWVRNAVLMNILYISKVQTRGREPSHQKKIKKENPCRRRTGVEVSGLKGLKHVTFKPMYWLLWLPLLTIFFFFRYEPCARGVFRHIDQSSTRLPVILARLGLFFFLFFFFFFHLYCVIVVYGRYQWWIWKKWSQIEEEREASFEVGTVLRVFGCFKFVFSTTLL